MFEAGKNRLWSKYHFPQKEPRFLEEIANCKSGVENAHDEPRTSDHTRKQRSYQRLPASCQKDTENKPVAQDLKKKKKITDLC